MTEQREYQDNDEAGDDRLKETARSIDDYMTNHREEMVRFLCDLVSIKSVTYKEEAAVSWYAEKLKSFGFDEVRVDPVGNCLGRVGNGKTVLLCDAHIDTVEPGDPEEWGFEPLQAKIENDTIIGRGAGDDKACLTGFAFAGKAIKELGLGENFTFWVSASIAEEDVEGSCVKAMMEEAPDIQPDFILVGEASEMRIIRGHKGRALLKVDVPGKAAHASAAWRGENALTKSIPLMQKIDAYNDFQEDPNLGSGSMEITNLKCGSLSFNTIPGKVTVFIDRRIACGESKKDLLEEIAPYVDEVGGRASIDVEHVTTYTGYKIEQEDYFPSWIIPEDHVLIRSGKQAFRTLFERTAEVGVWDFCSNATHLCGRTGIPSIGFGPGDGSLAHSNQDSVPVAELIDAAKFYSLFPVIISNNTT
ncbi:MAG: YgeY family selenium metabolism-linked hydrolase [Spirochaetia bacterium]